MSETNKEELLNHVDIDVSERIKRYKIEEDGKKERYRATVKRFTVVYTMSAIFVAIAYIISFFFPWSRIETTIPPQIIVIINDFPMFITAAFFGFLGSLVKETINSSKSEKFIYPNLFVGALIGLFSYLFIKSKVLYGMLYGVETTPPALSAHGVILVAAIAGMFAHEIVGVAKNKASGLIREPSNKN